jgi:ABC-type antimicrobial peptide transport system permease subunit
MRLDLPSVYGYYQSYSSAFLSLSLVPNGLIDEGDIIHGRLANNPNEIVLDIALIRNLINNNEEIRALDIKNPESFLKMELFLEVGNLRVYPYQIVGVSDTKAPVAYADESFIVLASQSGMHPREFFNEDNLTILAGRDIQSDTELLISSAFQNPSSFTESSINLSGEVYTIVGVYEVREEGVAMPFTQFIATTELINTMHFDNRTNQFHKAYIYSNNPSETVEHFLAEDQEAIHIYSVERARYLANSIENSIGSLIFSAVSLVATAISFYFVMRSSMISRIYEIGVYRALGTRRFELIKRFIVESAVLTTFSSLIGFGFMTYMIYTTNQRSESFFEVGHVSFLSILSGVLFIYLVNILSGTLPVMMLLRKTPAQIATSYDI